MHDATERGLFGGLHEIADASGVGILVHQDAIGMAPEVRAICDLFHINPYESSSEGTLILTCTEHHVAEVTDRLAAEGIAVYRIGEVVPADVGPRLVRNGREEPLPMPAQDDFWPAYVAARAGNVR
jgi:hydrogenase maturation factor